MTHTPPRRPTKMSVAGQALVAALVLALFMRLIVSILGLPGILNFAFFPILLFGVLASRRGKSFAEVRTAQSIVFITLAVIASTAANLSNPLAAALLWASLITPFLLVRLAITEGDRLGAQWSIERLLVLFLFIQGGVIGFERFVLGKTADAAQGFLAGQGAGHHVVGFIGVGTALYLTLRLLDQPGLRHRYDMYLAVLVGISIGVITSTLQAFLAFAVVGVSYVLTRRAGWPVTASLLIAATVLVAVFALWPTFTPPAKDWYGAEFFSNKGQTLTAIAHEYQDRPYQIFFGLGPGETATKVAWTGASAHGNLTASLGIDPGRVAGDLQGLERAKPVYRTSSLTAPWSTWLGIWGDLGLFGSIVYGWAWIAIASATLGPKLTNKRAGLYVVLFLALLGVFFNWLEEPVLTIFLGLAVADAIVRVPPGDTPLSERSKNELIKVSR